MVGVPVFTFFWLLYFWGVTFLGEGVGWRDVYHGIRLGVVVRLNNSFFLLPPFLQFVFVLGAVHLCFGSLAAFEGFLGYLPTWREPAYSYV